MTYSHRPYSKKVPSVLTMAARAGQYADSLEAGAAFSPTAYRSCAQVASAKLKKVLAITGGPLPQSLADESPSLIELWENIMFERYGSFQASHPTYLHAKYEATALIERAAGHQRKLS